MLLDWQAYDLKICGVASNGVNALEIIEKEKPDIVITDVNMPLMDGLELIKACAEDEQVKSKFIIISGYDEFEYAKKAMEYNVRYYLLKPIDEKELLEAIQKNIQIIKNDRENELLKKEKASSEMKIKLLENNLAQEDLPEIKNHFYLHDKFFQAVAIKIISGENKKNTHYGNQINSIISRLIVPDAANNLIETGKNTFCLILDPVIVSGFGNAQTFCAKLKNALTMATKQNIVISFGDVVENLGDFHSSYKDALLAQGASFYEGYNHVLGKKDSDRLCLKYDFKDVKIISETVEAIQYGSEAEIKDKACGFIAVLAKKRYSPEIIKSYLEVFKLKLMDLLKSFEEYNEDILKDEIFRLSDMTIDGFKAEFLEYCIKIAAWISEMKDKSTKGYIGTVEEYLLQNYHKDIHLKDIAQMLHMNPVYLGQQFKKQFGMYFTEYMHKIRIEKAKLLLENSDLKIYEIAEKVGYTNPDYFSSKFYQVVSLSPKKYRNLLMNNK